MKVQNGLKKQLNFIGIWKITGDITLEKPKCQMKMEILSHFQN